MFSRELATLFIGGKPVKNIGEYPWQALLKHEISGAMCGAVIISETHLLTAAHCVKDEYSMTMPTDKYYVRRVEFLYF